MRYALYYAPLQDTTLARLGARWLGRDAYTGEASAQPAIAGMDARTFAALTAEPRRYGFHATLKPPFRLADGVGAKDLLDAVEAFASKAAPLCLDRIAVSRIGRFVALTPVRPDAALGRLAASVVEAFDAFRAAPFPEETARRQQSGLSPAQETLLARWGYPYVMDEFRFHMTLTGAAEPALLERIEPAANAFFEEVLDRPLLLDSIAVFVQPAPEAPLVVAAQWPLAGSSVAETMGAGVSAPA
jgi:putative phosphonate metabolism protein